MPKACGEFVEPCGGTMWIISFINQDEVIRKILKHCNLWKEHSARAPPLPAPVANSPAERTYDTEFFKSLVG